MAEKLSTKSSGSTEGRWVLASGALSSGQSLVLSAFAVKQLSLPDFGLFTLCITSALFGGAMVRAAVAETGFEGLRNEALRRLFVFFAFLIGIVTGGILMTAQLYWAEFASRLVFPTAAICGTVASAEVAKVRLISQRRGSALFWAELCRLSLLSLLLLFAADTITDFLWSAAIVPAVTIVWSLTGSQGVQSGTATMKQRLVAATDVFVQRSAGQLATLLIFTSASASVVGTISAARLGFAPLTTLYTSAASLALLSGKLNPKRIRMLAYSVLAVGVLYALGFLVVIGVDGIGHFIFDENADEVRSVLVPISIFVVGGALAPMMSTVLRRLSEPALSLRARLVSSAGLILSVCVVLYALNSGQAIDLAWAYAVGGIFGLTAWVHTFRRVVRGKVPPTLESAG